jgi:hypothetical protein
MTAGMMDSEMPGTPPEPSPRYHRCDDPNCTPCAQLLATQELSAVISRLADILQRRFAHRWQFEGDRSASMGVYIWTCAACRTEHRGRDTPATICPGG